MRHSAVLGVVALGAAAALTASAQATFHLIQIQKAVGGVGGDTTAQAFQLRLRSSNQCFLAPARVRVYDAAGLNPVVVQDFSSCPPFPTPCATSCVTGSVLLIATASFSGHLDNPITPDFIMTNPIPASYLAAGSLTFENAPGSIVYWRVSWGGAAYTGSNDVNCINDDTACPGTGSVAPPFAGPLPSLSDQALEFQGTATAVSTTNADDYLVSVGAATFTNNANESGTIMLSVPCPWDCEATPNGSVGTTDLLALLGQWGSVGSCDFDGGGNVGTTDLLQVLANWGACP